MEKQQLDDAIWDLHTPMLRLALSICRHPQDAEDAVSAAVLAAYRKLHTLRSEAALKPWLLRITARCCYDLLRRKKRDEPIESEILETCLFEEIRENTLLELLKQLPPGQAHVLTLYYYEGFSAQEIGRILRLPRTTVSMRMSRGRHRLKEILKEQEDEE